ncbi:gastrula zinc finger protein XlCGF64.1-like [Pelobates fuscus]|uniref:gastrula zinc finger protein XlCGF64.1-like n=1 Tax=Pelobates fuscus TaxID=191477 RepID=UPI002FE47DC6
MNMCKRGSCAQDDLDVLLIDSRGVPYTMSEKSKSHCVSELPIKCKKQTACHAQANEKDYNSKFKREDKSLKCTDCSKRFKWPSHLKHHMRSHTNERPFKCTVCPKTFKDPHKLNRHQQIHPQFKKDMVYWKLYKCNICDKNFKYPSDLDKHNLIHTGEKPFKCPICGAGFRRFDHLKRHNFVHSGDRPFKCSVCAKGFVEATELLKHERTHTGNKPYQCTFCEKSFYHLRSLKEHAAAKHGLGALEMKTLYRDIRSRIAAAKGNTQYSSETSTKTGKNRLELENSECISTEDSPNEIVVCLSDDESESDTNIKDKEYWKMY